MRSGKSRLAAGLPSERSVSARSVTRSRSTSRLPPTLRSSDCWMPLERQVVDDALDADARRRVVGLAARFGRDELAVGARREIRLPERFAARRPQLRQRGPRVDADLARAASRCAAAGPTPKPVSCSRTYAVRSSRSVTCSTSARYADARAVRSGSSEAALRELGAHFEGAGRPERRSVPVRRVAPSVEPSSTSVAPSSSVSLSRAVARAPAVVPPASTSSVSYSAIDEDGVERASRGSGPAA